MQNPRTHFVAALVVGFVASLANAELITFDTMRSGEPLAAGTIIDNELGGWGLTVTAENYRQGHPDLAIIFDSTNPTGGDSDLRTPGSHPSNTVSYGNLLILAEDEIDANGDGLIDDPDDEGRAPAGWIDFSLDSVMSDIELVLVDTEEAGGFVDLYFQGQVVETLPIPTIANNAVQTIGMSDVMYDQFRVNLAGSGAIAQVAMIPEPAGLAMMMLGGWILLRKARS